MKKILLIEDEVHKREEIISYLREFSPEDSVLEVVDSVRSAVVSVSEGEYNLIVLDMALPTFSASGEVIDGGLDQAMGGVEVLRTLKSIGKSLNVMIITQYPDISLGGKRVKLSKAKVELERRYGQIVVGTVLYKYKSNLNKPKIKKIVDKIW